MDEPEFDGEAEFMARVAECRVAIESIKGKTITIDVDRPGELAD